jgi:hypothetical protein
MRDKPDYKKTYFEKILNTFPHTFSLNGIMRVMRQYGYYCEYDNGHYYVYTQHEWEIKLQYEDTAKSILDQLLGV